MGEYLMKLLATAILGLTLATTNAAPVKAEGNDLAKAILGIAAVAIIAKSIDDRNDRRRKASATVGASRLGTVDRHNDGRQLYGTVRPYDGFGPKAGRGYKKSPLPQSCLRIVDTGRRDRLAYGARCLDRNFRFASKLPDQCVTAVRTPRGVRTVYGARCLERDGWIVARR
ncbi:hypothetical protein BOA8489_01253 [Boseongicola aestuarii]|uniref:Uncharacterized protein n=2 Tax=Boseongicola aestuarii TaxID=1470561 RepID=A0A238IXE2_9RHOB|nr:hypothetical protein BOA8489_01253 [Boseongicola aestuarii]